MSYDSSIRRDIIDNDVILDTWYIYAFNNGKISEEEEKNWRGEEITNIFLMKLNYNVLTWDIEMSVN